MASLVLLRLLLPHLLLGSPAAGPLSLPAPAQQESRLEIAATWLALGLDTDNAIFYRQSDIPEIPELMWMLSCVCAKGLMNRAHAYKAAVAENEEAGNQVC